MKITVSKEDWIAELRSTDKKQLQRKLSNTEKTEMCCIGILCDMQAPDAWKSISDIYYDEDPGDSGKYLFWGKSGNLGSPSHHDLPDWMGLNQFYAAARLNDSGRGDFNVIADWAEAGMPIRTMGATSDADLSGVKT